MTTRPPPILGWHFHSFLKKSTSQVDLPEGSSWTLLSGRRAGRAQPPNHRQGRQTTLDANFWESKVHIESFVMDFSMIIIHNILDYWWFGLKPHDHRWRMEPPILDELFSSMELLKIRSERAYKTWKIASSMIPYSSYSKILGLFHHFSIIYFHHISIIFINGLV